ncbi:hypothetical protein ACQXZG_11990, partial [Corynebacterium diphtheriae]
QSGLRVLRSKRPLLQVARALCLLGTSLFFTAAPALHPAGRSHRSELPRADSGDGPVGAAAGRACDAGPVAGGDLRVCRG